jgi:hypothetical protein
MIMRLNDFFAPWHQPGENKSFRGKPALAFKTN